MMVIDIHCQFVYNRIIESANDPALPKQEIKKKAKSGQEGSGCEKYMARF